MAPSVEQYNKDELEAPQWMDHGFFTKVLGQSEKTTQPNLKVKSVKISPATVQGDHYASVMFRAVVNYECGGKDKSKSLIIKTMPVMEGAKKDMLGETFIFETEIGMYTEVLPRFEQILRSVGDKTVLKAPCLYHALSPNKLIIFEDIVPQGYTVLRDRHVNNTEVKCVYTKLAKWHAISYKLNREEPQYFENYRHNFLAIPDMLKNDFMTDGITNFIAQLDVEPTLKVYKPYFEQMRENILPKSVESFQEYRIAPRENATYVLCHGDFHRRNLMFKHNPSNGQVDDVMLLDFQLCFIGPCILDLIYSYFMLLNPENRPQFSEFLYFYHTQLTKTLKEIGYKGRMPRLGELHEERVRHRHWEFFLLVTFLPLCYALDSGKNDPDELLHSADVRRELSKNPKFIKELQTLLPQYLYAGFFEDL